MPSPSNHDSLAEALEVAQRLARQHYQCVAVVIRRREDGRIEVALEDWRS